LRLKIRKVVILPRPAKRVAVAGEIAVVGAVAVAVMAVADVAGTTVGDVAVTTMVARN